MLTQLLAIPEQAHLDDQASGRIGTHPILGDLALAAGGGDTAALELPQVSPAMDTHAEVDHEQQAEGDKVITPVWSRTPKYRCSVKYRSSNRD